MRTFMKNFLRKTDKPESDSLSQKVLDSQLALKLAATGTMRLAEDVTSILKDKIDDYVKQIDSTSKILSDALLLVREDGVIESFNPAAERIFGWPVDYIMGKHIRLLFQFEIPDQNYAELLAGFCEEQYGVDSQVVEYEDFYGIHKNGNRIFVDVSGTKLERVDNTISYLIVVRDVTKRVESERELGALAARNQQLITAVNASQTGIIITDPSKPDNPIIFANEGFCSMSGYSRSELLGNNARFLQGNLKADGYEAIKEGRIKAQRVRAEVPFQRKDGRMIWMDIDVSPVFENEQIKYFVAIQYETTELHTAREELRQSEQHFRAFGETSSEAMMIHSSTQVLDWNPRLNEISGYSNQEISKMNPMDFVHPLERETIMNFMAGEEPIHYETLYMTKSGDVLEVAINAQPVDWQNEAARIKVIRDVTLYKDVEKLLRSSRERYRTIIDNTIDLVCCFDTDFKITFVNQTFWEYFEVDLDDVIGKSLLDFMPEDDHPEIRSYLATISIDTPVRRGLHRVARQGELRWQDWIDRAIFDDDGNIIEYQSVSRDITHYMMMKKES